jgi:hypothetical protein
VSCTNFEKQLWIRDSLGYKTIDCTERWFSHQKINRKQNPKMNQKVSV